MLLCKKNNIVIQEALTSKLLHISEILINQIKLPDLLPGTLVLKVLLFSPEPEILKIIPLLHIVSLNQVRSTSIHVPRVQDHIPIHRRIPQEIRIHLLREENSDTTLRRTM